MSDRDEKVVEAAKSALAWFEAAGADSPSDEGTDWLNEGGWELEAPRVIAQLRAALAAAPAPLADGREVWPADAKFSLGQFVEKKGRAAWGGHIRGWYRTDLTAIGYAVESNLHSGSVQIYPETALLAALSNKDQTP